jgi:hypothetical protein
MNVVYIRMYAHTHTCDEKDDMAASPQSLVVSAAKSCRSSRTRHIDGQTTRGCHAHNSYLNVNIDSLLPTEGVVVA